MQLRDYINERRGRAAELARSMGISPTLISQWAAEIRGVPAERCPAIEKATGGVVRCEDMRPDVEWAYLRATNCDQAKVSATTPAPDVIREVA